MSPADLSGREHNRNCGSGAESHALWLIHKWGKVLCYCGYFELITFLDNFRKDLRTTMQYKQFVCLALRFIPHEPRKQEAQRATYRATEYNVQPFWGIGQGGSFCLLIGQQNTNLVEDVEILLPVKFPWIKVSGFRGEVENVSVNQRPGWPSCFSDRPEKKNKLGRGRWDLASCQVSLNSVQQFQRRSRKCLSQLEARAAILFSVGPKNTNLVEDVEILLPVKFPWIPFSGFRGEVENVSANQRPGRPSCFFR